MRKLDPKKHPKLIAFLEKTQKILKTVAVICFSLVIVLCVFFYTKACADKNTAQLINASAEASTVAETASDVESGIDLTQYPSANLIDVSKMTNGVLSENDGIFTMTKKANNNRFSGIYTFPEPLPAGAYTFSCDFISYSGDYFYWLQGVVTTKNDNVFGFSYSVSSGSAQEVRTFTFNDDLISVKFYLDLADEVGTTYKFKNFMMNAGDTAYPYIPNLDNVYENGYNAGYGAGETYGKESGYNDGLEQAQYGMWANSTVNLRTSLNHTTIFNWSGVPEIFSQGVSFNGIYELLKDNADILRSSLFDLVLNFSAPVQLADFGFKIFSPLPDAWKLSVSVKLITKSHGELNTIVRDFDEDSSFLEVQIFDGSEVYSDIIGVELIFSEFSVLKGTTFSNYEPYYNQGYEAGYQAGYNDNGAYDDGYKNGYTVGKSDGFQEGFNQSEKGSFGWLISSVQEFLNVNFFGEFGIGTLVYVGLGLTLVSIFLRVFAGG